MTHDDELFQTVVGFSRKGREADALRAVLELAVVAVGADEGALLLIDDDGHGGESLVFVLNVTRTGDRADSPLIGQRVPMNAGVTGAAAMLREVQIGRPSYGDLPHPDDQVPSMVLAAPVVAGDDLLGVITAVGHARDHRFDADHARRYAQAATAVAALAEQRRRLGWLQSLQTGKTLEVSRTEAQRLELELVRAVLDLARARPTRLGDVAKLVRIIHGLVKDPSP